MSGDRYIIANQEQTYFLTLTVVDWVDVFTRKDYKIIIVDSLNFCIAIKGLEVYAWVIMSNHLHLIVKAKEGFVLSHILRDFKKFTSKEISAKILEIGESRREWILNKFAFEAKRTGRAKNYKLWRDDNHAICLEKTEWLVQRINYIHQNPVRRMIVDNECDYIFSSAIDYADGKGLVNIIKI
jgi:REP element-mobilizing transposase RayT